MREPDGMQRIPEHGGDVGKVGCTMVVEYFEQQIATVISRSNPESNHVDHRSVFCCGNAWRAHRSSGDA